MSELTVEAIIAEVRRLAAEQPDFVYTTSDPQGECQYVEYTYDIEHDPDVDETYYTNPHDPRPGCIFGHALLNLGVDHDVLNQVIGIETMLASIGVEADEASDEVEWMQGVQYKQDHHMRWADAVSLTDKEMSGNI